MVNIVALRWLFSPIFTICLVRSWSNGDIITSNNARIMEDDEEKPKRTRSVTSAADRLPSTASTAEARASAAVPPPKVREKGWNSGEIVGDFEGFYSKNCGDDPEISGFWWNWIGNMWIYHDLSGNLCYLRWLYDQTRVRSWRANIEYTGWEFHRRWGLEGKRYRPCGANPFEKPWQQRGKPRVALC